MSPDEVPKAESRDDIGSQVDVSGLGPSHAMPERIGHFRIVQLIGEGGMGVVYEAQQEKPRRTVR